LLPADTPNETRRWAAVIVACPIFFAIVEAAWAIGPGEEGIFDFPDRSFWADREFEVLSLKHNIRTTRVWKKGKVLHTVILSQYL
jgi:hypothetical protein